VDHVATLREARKVDEPSPITAAILAELGGVSSIIVHLREDRRHIQEKDVRLLKEVIKTSLNLEMAATDAMVKFALSIKPDKVTLVPERREELTTEGGLDVIKHKELIISVTELLEDAGIKVSLFIDPEMEQLKASSRTNATYVELHTGKYSNAKDYKDVYTELRKLSAAAAAAEKMGLHVCAGHGLNYQNVKLVAQIKEIEELSIGHSIVSRAVLVGMTKAVEEMIKLIS